MSKLSKAVEEIKRREDAKKDLRLNEVVLNFMGGASYVINPIDTLKMITASSIFGEPQYYRAGGLEWGSYYKVDEHVQAFSFLDKKFFYKTTSQIMTEAINDALSYDFEQTLQWAVTLRREYNIRLNPQVIMVRAALHEGRKKFTENNPSKFKEYNAKVMLRADDTLSQISYYLCLNNGEKNRIPSVLKRSWADALSKLDRYRVAKYKNHEIGLINAVRICHAHSDVIDELMRTGSVKTDKADKTWENLRSEGKGWKEIFDTVDMGHMAILRNIRGMFVEIDDYNFCKEVTDKLKSGVKGGKQLPFRYYSARSAIGGHNCNHVGLIGDALEECLDISMENFPQLKGRTMCLSDNSGSAWGGVATEFGYVTVAEIDNLSSTITAARSDEGYVGKFGDDLITYPIQKRSGILEKTRKISGRRDRDVGGGTEGGIWIFFNNAIEKKEHWDNIFIYSDMQAGHGGLYGTDEQKIEYLKRGFGAGGYNEENINVFKLVNEYRDKVNPKVNVFTVQTAGYNNTLLPEFAYRTGILYGWTGKEVVFADAMIKLWNDMDKRNGI